MNNQFIEIKSNQHKTAGPYSPVLGVNCGRLYIISGQAPVDMEGKTIGKTIEEQSHQTLKNCITQLEAAGCSPSDVFKVTVYLKDLKLWNRFNEIYKQYFEAPYPTRSAIQVGLLDAFLVEIEMWAMKSY